MRNAKILALSVALLAAIGAVYSNHFHNEFHFDDTHAIVNNPYIRDLKNIPKFFQDATTFSTLPANQTYRPVVTTSLAIDYALGKGLKPLWFHVTTFGWFLALVVLTALLAARVLDASKPSPANPYIALFAAAWLGLHPVSAETVNYAIQRGDLYATLAVVAGMVVYCYWPKGRKTFLYLVPVAIGSLAKPSSLIFPAFLLIYVYYFESAPRAPEGKTAKSPAPKPNLKKAAMAAVPAVAMTAASGIFQAAMTPKSLTPGQYSKSGYWMTQPVVWLHYFASFFLPTHLSADTDRPLVTDVFSGQFLIGIAFVAALIFAIWWASRKAHLMPIAFGLLWFALGLLPTSLTPLAEVENDHRMFMSFVGLSIAVTWAMWMFLVKDESKAGGLLPRAAAAALGICLLAGYGYGAHARNEVWRTDESLWKDVSEKSPRNGRGLMNYALVLMGRGDYKGSLDLYLRAEKYNPNYSLLHVNMAIAYGASGNDTEAESHFRKALQLAPADYNSYFFYARWQKQKGMLADAATNLETALLMNPAYMDTRYLLMQIYSEQNDVAKLRALAQQTLSMFPGDQSSAQYLASANDPARTSMKPGSQALRSTVEIVNAELAVKQSPTAENYLNLSLAYELAGRHDDCVRAANEALRLRPNYAEAYNNIAAANQSVGKWDEAIAAAQKAVELSPNFQLAKNNLAYSMSQKKLRESAGKR